MFLFAAVVWAIIEGYGIVTGMRTYEPYSDRLIIFYFVAIVEDSGWVCLGYMGAEQIFKRLARRKAKIAAKTTIMF